MTLGSTPGLVLHNKSFVLDSTLTFGHAYESFCRRVFCPKLGLSTDILECEVKWALEGITATKLVVVMEFQLSCFKS